MEVNVNRFKGIEKKEFELEILTPMFLGGASVQEEKTKNVSEAPFQKKKLNDTVIKTELRAASIKGVLRFWWRALQSETNINNLLKKESEIFGSANSDSGGKSKVRVVVDKDEMTYSNTYSRTQTVCINQRARATEIYKYMTVGLYDFKEHNRIFNRNYFIPGGKFKLKLYFPKNERDVLLAFYLMITFGGLGAKSRNGFGSLKISQGETIDIINELKGRIFHTPYTALRYAAFSRDFKLYQSRETFKTSHDALVHGFETFFALKKTLKPDTGCKKRRYLGLPLIPCHQNGRHAKWIFMSVNPVNGGYKSNFLLLPHRLNIKRFNPRDFDTVFEHVKNKIKQNPIRIPAFHPCDAENLGGNYEQII